MTLAQPADVASGPIPRVLATVRQVVVGKDEAIRLALCCLIARGHLLIEDIPGVGKTTLAHALARALGLHLRRIQFTSDLLPADIIGNAIFDREQARFVFHPGPIFAPVLLADEVNRATPKTQSALLEAMEERQVTVEGLSHPLPAPFFVIATQNPSQQIGTFPLPESQLDRFLMRLELGYPDRAAEADMLGGPDRRRVLADLPSALRDGELTALQAQAEAVTVAPALRDYLLDLLARSRGGRAGQGLSPRAGLALQHAARAWALMAGRTAVLPEDVQAVAPAVMGHRLRAADRGGDGAAMAAAILRETPVP